MDTILNLGTVVHSIPFIFYHQRVFSNFFLSFLDLYITYTVFTCFSFLSARGPKSLFWLLDPYRMLVHPGEQLWSFQSRQHPSEPFFSFHLKIIFKTFLRAKCQHSGSGIQIPFVYALKLV